MLPSCRTSMARAVQRRLAFQGCVARTTHVRFQSTASGGQSSWATHLAAGVAGGAVVIAGGYAYYHFSGAKKAIDTAKATKAYLEQTAQSIREKAPKNPNEAIAFLRDVAKKYTSIIPGLSTYVDSTFDTLDELHDSHREEVNKILSEAYEGAQDAVKGEKSVADVEVAKKLWAVLGKMIFQLQDLSKRAGSDAFAKLEKRHPQIAQTLGAGYKNLKELAERSGPDAKKIYDETTQQLKSIFAQGFSQDALGQARELIESKSNQIQEIARRASQKAWEGSVSRSSAYLDKLPDIRQLLSDNANKFIAAGASAVDASSEEAEEVLDKVKEVAELEDDGQRRERLKELREFIIRKADEAQQRGSRSMERGWESLQEWMKMVPGGGDALEKLPDVKVFVALSQKKGEDARKLAKETYDDVFRVLEEKAKKAKGIVEDTKQEAKKEGS